MQVTTEQIDPCKIDLTITVEAEKVAEARERAVRQAAANIQLPGFRKGKVPMHMARPYVDTERVRQRTAEALAGPAYAEAVAETQVEPFAQPELEIVTLDDDGGPFVFKAHVPLRPVITLGPYKELAVERRRLQVTVEDVDRQIENIRTRHAEYPEVEDRAAQMGDILLAHLAVEIDGQEANEPRDVVIEVGKNIPDFDNGLVGMEAGETKTIDALYPEDFSDESLQGKRATFTVTVKEIRTREMPELTEEFVQKVHPTAKNEEELRVEVRDSLEKAADQMADDDLEMNLVRQIVASSQIAYPEILQRAEMQEDARNLQARLEREKMSLEDFLEASGKTREEVEAEMARAADIRIRNSLALSEIARVENLELDEADVDAQIAERAAQAKVSAAAVRAYAEKNNQMDAFRNQAMTGKILNFLRENANVTERLLTGDEMDALRSEYEAEAGPAALLDDEDDEDDEVSGGGGGDAKQAAAPLAVETATKTTTRRRSKKKIEDAQDAETADES